MIPSMVKKNYGLDEEDLANRAYDDEDEDDSRLFEKMQNMNSKK